MSRTIRLSPGKKVLYLTKDPDLIRKQLNGECTLTFQDIQVSDLLDNINTDTMTPAWVCFNHDPDVIAQNAYAGLVVDNERIFPHRALYDSDFEVIVSGQQKGVGSSRETAVQAEKWSGIRIAIASSFAPIHERNNINQGILMAGHDVLEDLESGKEIPLEVFTKKYDPVTRLIIEHGGLFSFMKALDAGEITLPQIETDARPMNMTEKILVQHLHGVDQKYLKAGDTILAKVDGGYSHEFTTAQVDYFLEEAYGKGYSVQNPEKFAVFEDHLIYADGVEKMAPYSADIQTLRDLQRNFQKSTGVRNYAAVQGVSPGICHQVAREEFIDPGDFIQATDSHTCMGGSANALAYGVGTTEYASLLYSGYTFVEVPEAICFELVNSLRDGVTAKDIMLFILSEYAKREETLDRVIEFTGSGLHNLSMDERATLANMATECTAKGSVIEPDAALFSWIEEKRGQKLSDEVKGRAVCPDPDAQYAGGKHIIDLALIEPMVATPGDPAKGIASDPKNGKIIRELGDVCIDIAYGGSCTAGKEDDIDFYVRVLKEAHDAGLSVHDDVSFYIQYGSESVMQYAESKGYDKIFKEVGVQVINPGCGACIGCGPGVSTSADQVTVSAINRNYKGRSGPGNLYLASPLTVAASAITGKISSYERGMFRS